MVLSQVPTGKVRVPPPLSRGRSMGLIARGGRWGGGVRCPWMGLSESVCVSRDYEGVGSAPMHEPLAAARAGVVPRLRRGRAEGSGIE